MKKVLIIEDEDSALEILNCNIKRRGYNVEIAQNGEDGFRKIVHCSPDIILLDIKLPDIDGWEILKRMNASGMSCSKVIILSAATQKTDRERAESQSVSLFMAKPFDLPELLGSIARLTLHKI